MRVFITGGSGWVGSHVIAELLSNGHTIVALARTPASADKIRAASPAAAGAQLATIAGDLKDIPTLVAAAKEADAVIHLGFNHDFSQFEASLKQDVDAVSAIGDALSGTGKTLINVAGLMIHTAPGVTLDEAYRQGEMGRGASENKTLSYAQSGVRAMSIRLSPHCHGTGASGFVPFIGMTSKRIGFVPVVDPTSNWPSVHVKDVARLYRLALEKGQAGKVYHACAEETIPIGSVADAIAKKVGVPTKPTSAEEIQKELGFAGMVWSKNIIATAGQTKSELGWAPQEIGLVEDIQKNYFN